MAALHFSLYVEPKFVASKVKLESVDLKKNVCYLKKTLSEKLENVCEDNLSIVYHGEILKDDKALEEFGIKSESVLYCFSKSVAKNSPEKIAGYGLIELQTLIVTLRAAVTNPAFRSTIKKLQSLNEFKEILEKNPTLASHPQAIAYLQDPEFLIALQSPVELIKVVDEMPVFGKALETLCVRISKEVTVNDTHLASSASYSMDALSDDDDMDTTEQGDSNPGSRVNQPITGNQLAAALANVAGRSGQRSGSTPSPSTTSTQRPSATPASSGGSGQSSGNTTITHDMFNQAIQSAIAASTSTTPSRESDSTSRTVADSEIPNMAESLQLMREMGIVDEPLAIQALRATNGDVQAAVDLIFAQWMADD